MTSFFGFLILDYDNLSPLDYFTLKKGKGTRRQVKVKVKKKY